VLQPGEEGAIEINLDGANFVGHKTVRFYLITDNGWLHEIRILVRADSRRELYFTPERLDFGKVKRGATPTSQMAVYFPDHTKLRVTDAKSDNKHIHAWSQELRRDGDHVAYQVSASIPADMPIGTWHTDVWLTTDDPAFPRLRVPVTLEVVAE
jgi:hypothetical protein